MSKKKRKKKIQWHPGFVTGIDLELSEYRSEMIQEREYNLNTKPLSIDVLIRKNDNTVVKDNEIGMLFRRYNIVEYKSPDDHMDIDTYYKVNGYACLFKAYGEQVDSIKAEDITISLFRHTKPEGLFRHFKREGILIANPYPGIYYVEGNSMFSMQIVVTRELNPDKHIWLVALSGRLKKEQVEKVLKRASQLTDEREKRLADSVLQVCIAANKAIVEELKREEESMCQALREIMEPELKQSMKEGMKKGILVTVKSLREVGQKDEDIKSIIVKNFELQPAEAENYMIF